MQKEELTTDDTDEQGPQIALDKARRSGMRSRLSNAEAGLSGELEMFGRELADHRVTDRHYGRFDNSASSIGGYRKLAPTPRTIGGYT